MNSTYAKLIACDQAIAKQKTFMHSHGMEASAYRRNSKILQELSMVRNRVIRNGGPYEFGPNHPPRNVARWQMTENEWAGMETPGIGT